MGVFDFLELRESWLFASIKTSLKVIFINLQITQAVYFTLALVNDFAGSNAATTGDRPFIRKIRDYVFGSLAFPLAFDVGGLFWVLYAIDRELVSWRKYFRFRSRDNAFRFHSRCSLRD